MTDFPILFDGEPTTLSEFIDANTAPNVEPIPDDHMAAVKNLQPGESVAIGIGGGGFIEIARPDAA